MKFLLLKRTIKIKSFNLIKKIYNILNYEFNCLTFVFVILVTIIFFSNKAKTELLNTSSILPIVGNFETFKLEYNKPIKINKNRGFKNQNKTIDNTYTQFSYFKKNKNYNLYLENGFYISFNNEEKEKNLSGSPENDIKKIGYFEIINPKVFSIKNMKYKYGISLENNVNKKFYCIETSDYIFLTKNVYCPSLKPSKFLNQDEPLLSRRSSALTLQNSLIKENLNWKSKNSFEIGLSTSIINNKNIIAEKFFSDSPNVKDFIPRDGVSIINLLTLAHGNTKILRKNLGFSYILGGYMPLISNYYNKKIINDDVYGKISTKIINRINKKILLELDFSYSTKYPIDRNILVYSKYQESTYESAYSELSLNFIFINPIEERQQNSKFLPRLKKTIKLNNELENKRNINLNSKKDIKIKNKQKIKEVNFKKSNLKEYALNYANNFDKTIFSYQNDSKLMQQLIQ